MLLKKTQRLLLLAVLLAGTIPSLATAGEPTAYRVLQVGACPEIQPAPAAPYAYGWFGASPRVHWSTPSLDRLETADGALAAWSEVTLQLLDGVLKKR